MIVSSTSVNLFLLLAIAKPARRMAQADIRHGAAVL
jgi:hypothetical protein